jgi:phosphoribosylanthranilate isomerase
VKIKICGLKIYAHAALAVELGADLLGFNFYPASPRYIQIAACRLLVLRLRETFNSREVKFVGVFVNSPADEVQNVLDECCLDLAQLSGDEPPELLEALGNRAYKAVRLGTPASVNACLASDFRRYAKPRGEPALLADAYQRGAYGGTGQPADWGLARDLAIQIPILLAGGLTPDNVREAIRQVRPWGVDVASGIESSPGCKDPDRMAAFINAVRGCEQEADSC